MIARLDPTLYAAWRYLGTVIAAARKGLPLPVLPAIPVAAAA